MERIICDSFVISDLPEWKLEPESKETREFNRKIHAVNDMYMWLYNKGVLREVAFVMKDYGDTVYFAFDAKDLEPYRAKMEASGVKDADIAVQHIFDVEYTPCRFSGAIDLTWPMFSYRNIDEMVGRSWETSLCKHLNATGVLDVREVKEKDGARAAVKRLFELSGFVPDRFDRACEYYKDWVDAEDKENRDYLYLHADKIIYCYEHKKDMLDFDFWCQYELLLGEKISWDEYVAIDNSFDGDPHDIEADDVDMISVFKNALKEYRVEINKNYDQDDIKTDSEWVVTDPDYAQVRRQPYPDESKIFKLMQVDTWPMDDKTTYKVAVAEIDLDDYSDEEISSMLDSYGYDDMTALIDVVGGEAEAYGQIAEMFFETFVTEYYIGRFDSWNEAVAEIEERTGLDLGSLKEPGSQTLDDTIRDAEAEKGETVDEPFAGFYDKEL